MVALGEPEQRNLRPARGGGNNEIENEALSLFDIPAADAPFEAVRQFGYTFNGFEQLGSFKACAEVANEPRHNTLTELRACLFFEQRRWRHSGYEPDAKAEQYQRDLVEKIRAMVLSSAPVGVMAPALAGNEDSPRAATSPSGLAGHSADVAETTHLTPDERERCASGHSLCSATAHFMARAKAKFMDCIRR